MADNPPAASPPQPRTYSAAEIADVVRAYGLIVGVETDGTLHVYPTPTPAASPMTAREEKK